MSCLDDAKIVAFAQGELTPTERAAVRNHLEGCPVCTALVSEAARGLATLAEPDAGSPAAPLPTPKVPARGTAVGRYLLLEPLGEGGLGQVFKAYDPQLDRQVAIKLIKQAALVRANRSELTARMIREAQSLARVRHPNVVAVHDAGAWDEQVFVAMELVEGATLAKWLRAETRSWDAIRDVFLEAGRGLLAAHEAGLVHRDFKPSNVLIGRSGRAQVADFGLARTIAHANEDAKAANLSGTSASQLSSITESGVVLGTPAYMAPEQLVGTTVDARADQFSFCVTLFEALYGVRPFAAPTSEERLDAIEAHRIADVDRTAAPAWLRRVIERGLAASPDDRFESMAPLLAALVRDRRSRRRRGMTTFGLVLAALFGAGARTLLAPPSEEELDRIEQLAAQAEAAAARAHYVYPPVEGPDEPTAYHSVLALEAITGAAESQADERALELRGAFATTLTEQGDRFWDRPGGKAFAAEYYAQAVMFEPGNERARERMGVTPVGFELLRDKAARLSFSENELDAAGPLAVLATHDDDALEGAVDSFVQGDRLVTATTREALARLSSEAVEPADEAGQPELEPVIEIEADSETDPEAEADHLRRREPRKHAAADVKPARPSGDPEAPADPEAALAEVARGEAALARVQLGEAAAAFHSALRYDRRCAAASAGLAEVYFQQGSLENAARSLERATRAAPKRGSYRIHLGDVYFKQLRYEDARGQYERARELGHAAASKRLQRIADRLGE